MMCFGGLKAIFGVFLLLVLSGCASLWPAPEPVVTDIQVLPKEQPIRFSENPNVGVFNAKKYKRATRQSLEEESQLQASAGSLWRNDGQGAYLFAQNTQKRDGDMVTVKIDNSAKAQIDTKVSVIKKLLARLDAAAVQPKPEPQTEGTDASRQLASVGDGADQKVATPIAPVAQKQEETDKDEPINIETVPTKIVEKIADGSYRIKGSQPFMIGKREYKVIVTGVVRSEDFNDEGVSASKLLDPQYDVVSIRRSSLQ